MRIYTDKKLAFRNPATGERFSTRLKDFTDAPDWIEKDPLAAWAEAEGTLKIFRDEPVKPVQVKGRAKKEADAQ